MRNLDRKYETLDSTQIKSLYETGKIPEVKEDRALSYDEVKSKMAETNVVCRYRELHISHFNIDINNIWKNSKKFRKK